MYIKPFGEIEIEELDEVYDGLLKIQQNYVEVELNFDSEIILISQLESVERFICSVENKAKKAFDAISDDFDLGEEGVSDLYLKYHISEFNDGENREIFEISKNDKFFFIKHLKLYKISIYPEDIECFSVFDIQFPREYTNYLIAVTFNVNGWLTNISMES